MMNTSENMSNIFPTERSCGVIELMDGASVEGSLKELFDSPFIDWAQPNGNYCIDSLLAGRRADIGLGYLLGGHSVVSPEVAAYANQAA
jgi:hypothetical protein